MVQQLDRLKETASQTAGPYVHIGLAPNFIGIPGVYTTDLGSAMVNDKTRGERITVTGRVFDGSGAPVKDAVIEIWQADAAGLFNSPSETRGKADPDFAGWGRQPVDIDRWELRLPHDQAGPGAMARRADAGSAHLVLDRGARHQYRASHAHVFLRRGGG